MKSLLIGLLFSIQMLGFFQIVGGQTKPIRRALLVGIGNYVEDSYQNSFSGLEDLIDSKKELDAFTEFCDLRFAECQVFLKNPEKFFENRTSPAPDEIKNFYDFVKSNSLFSNRARWFSDYIFYKRRVYNHRSINLGRGPHNDVLNMTRILAQKYRFEEIYILLEPGILRDKTEEEINKIRSANPGTKIETVKKFVPSNDGIEKAFEEFLIKPPCEKDKRNCKAVFYFSGHGSQRVNPQETEDQLDETLVTLDVVSGKPDLRDDKLAELYDKALAKTDLTVISDSCHSGDNYKHVMYQTLSKTISDDPRPVASEDFHYSSDPVKNGLLFFAASRTNETAGSNSALSNLFDNTTEQSQQGIFTHHFIRTLLSVNDTTAREIFERTRASMERNQQQPVARGLSENQNTNFFGDEVLPFRFSISRVENDVFYINGGRLNGLERGVQLKNQTVCLKVESVTLQTATAKLCSAFNTANKSTLIGTEVTQTSWTIPTKEDALKFWISSPPPKKEVDIILNRIGKVIETDVTKEISHLLYYENSQWQLCSITECAPVQIDKLSLTENDKILFVNPLDRSEEHTHLRKEFDQLNFGARLVDRFDMSEYFLVASPDKKYAWVNRNSLRWRRPDSTKILSGGGVQNIMPSNTKYVSLTFKNETSEVGELAQTLAKMFSWITLKLFSPSSAEPTIKLSVFDENNKPIVSGDFITVGSYLRFSIPKFSRFKSKFYYLISFNDKGVMTFENESSFNKCMAQLTESDCFIEEVPSVPENFGNKVFILLSTEEQIINARSVLNAEGVKSAYSNPLLSLVYQMQTGKKSTNPQPTIQNWMVDSFYLKFKSP